MKKSKVLASLLCATVVAGLYAAPVMAQDYKEDVSIDGNLTIVGRPWDADKDYEYNGVHSDNDIFIGKTPKDPNESPVIRLNSSQIGNYTEIAKGSVVVVGIDDDAKISTTIGHDGGAGIRVRNNTYESDLDKDRFIVNKHGAVMTKSSITAAENITAADFVIKGGLDGNSNDLNVKDALDKINDEITDLKNGSGTGGTNDYDTRITANTTAITAIQNQLQGVDLSKVADLEGRVSNLEEKTQNFADGNGNTGTGGVVGNADKEFGDTTKDGNTYHDGDLNVNGDVQGKDAYFDNLHASNEITVGEGDNMVTINGGDGSITTGDTIINGDSVTTNNITANEGNFTNITSETGSFTTEVNVGTGDTKITIDGTQGSITTGDTIISGDSVTTNNINSTNITAENGNFTNITSETGNFTNEINVGDVDGEHITITNNDISITNGEGETVSLGGVADQIDGLEEQMGSMNSRLSKVEDRIDKVGAMSAAIANLRTMGYDPTAPTEIAVGIGQYRSETGAALGFFHYPNQDFMLSLSVSTSGDEVMGGIGATWKFGRKTPAQLLKAEQAKVEKAKIAKAEAMKKAAKEEKVKAQQKRHAEMAAK